MVISILFGVLKDKFAFYRKNHYINIATLCGYKCLNMSLTLNKIIADIRNISTSGSNPIEFKIEERQLEFWINETRSLLISQAIQKKQDISDLWIQSISCLQLELADESECCNLPTGCYMLKSIKKIPRTIETWSDNTINRVLTAKGEIISKTSNFENRYNKYNKYVSNKRTWYLKNDYLYITNETILDTVTLYGIFDDPSELSGFIGCDNNSCFNYNSVYPCSLKMASMITDIVIKTKVLPYLQLPADNRNDAANISEQSNTKV